MPSGAYDIAVEIALPALLRGLTTKDDIRNVQKLCQQLVGVEGQAWHVLFSTFFTTLVSTRDALPTNLVAREIDLSPDWFREPWYLMYPQWTGLEEKDLHTPSNFDTLRAMLPHIRHTLGFKNICLLPHYESPMADAGRDLSSYSVRESLGGREAFLRFMQDAHNLDMRVATDALFTHTSTEHPWFQSALSGDHKYLAYYLQRNGREKIAEWDDQGEIVCRYRDADGTITDRIVAYPHVDRTHGLWVEIHGKTYQFYRSGFPFQVDLNLRNVELVEELFGVLADEVLCGVLGKRLDSVAEWVKKGGVKDVGLSECHVLQAIFKSFLKHLHCRAVIISDVVGDVKRSASYSGMNTHINGEACSSEGDAILGIGMKAALQESMFFQSVVPFWRCVFRGDDLSGHSTWLNMLEDHNEMHMNLFPGEVRRCMVEYIKAHGGMVYNNETRGCIRHADSLGNKGERLATAIFMLYMAPGTPLIYAGTEIEACNNWEHAKREAVSSKQIFEKVGVYATPEARFDARNLQRGGLLHSDLRKAEEHEAGRLVKRMNELRSERECLRVANIRAVDCGDVGVLCMGRGTEGDSVLCIANLTSLEKLVSIPLRSAAEFVGRGVMRREKKRVFVDLISGKKVELLREGLYVKMSLHGFSYAVIQQSTDEGKVY